MDGWMDGQKSEQNPEGPRGRGNSIQPSPQTTAEAGDASGRRQPPDRAKPSASPWRQRQDPPPPSGCSLGLLIWRWNARYPHWFPLGPLSRQPHARNPYISGGWGGDTTASCQELRPNIPGGLRGGSWGWGCDPSRSLLVNTKPPSRHAGVRGLSAWLPEHLTGAESGEGMEIPG